MHSLTYCSCRMLCFTPAAPYLCSATHCIPQQVPSHCMGLSPSGLAGATVMLRGLCVSRTHLGPRLSLRRQGLTPVDHARANAAAVRRQSAENRQRKADEEAAAVAAEAAARAATAVPGVRSSGYASPTYHPGCERACCRTLQSVLIPATE